MSSSASSSSAKGRKEAKTRDRFHSSEVSTLLQRFPVDLKEKETKTIAQRELPGMIATSLTIRGCTTTKRSIANTGGIKLFPALASVRDRNNPEVTPQIADAYGTYRALIDSQFLQTAYTELVTDPDGTKDFLICLVSNNGSDFFTLYGEQTFLDGPNEGTFGLSRDINGRSDGGIPLDPSAMHQIMSSVIRQQQNDVKPEDTISDMFHQLSDASSESEIEQIGSFVDASDISRRRIDLELRATAAQSAERLEQYRVMVEDTRSIQPDIRGSLIFTSSTSLEYSRVANPRYTATIGALIQDPEQKYSEEERDGLFETYVRTNRSDPTLFFQTLARAARKLADFSNF